MKARKNTFILIAFLAFVAGVLLVLETLINKTNSVTPLPPTPIITISPTPAANTEIKQKLISLMPIVTEDYTIEYLPRVDKFSVLVLKEPFETYKQEAQQWFYNQGLTSLEEIKISFDSLAASGQ